MVNNAVSYLRKTLLALGALWVLMLGGCASHDNSDLYNQLSEIKARPAAKIPPLPVFKPYKTFLYSARDERDPFKLKDVDSIAEGDTEEVFDLPKEISDRNKEALEQYPLDSLKYVGQLTKDGTDWGIVTSPDNIVHRVRSGNYIGQNYGKIITIEEDRIIIVETIPDKMKGWIQRDAALSLME